MEEGVNKGRNGGDDKDNGGLAGGEKRVITTGRGARRRLQRWLPHPGRGKLKGGLERQVRVGEHREGRSGATNSFTSSSSEKDVSFLISASDLQVEEIRLSVYLTLTH